MGMFVHDDERLIEDQDQAMFVYDKEGERTYCENWRSKPKETKPLTKRTNCDIIIIESN